MTKLCVLLLVCCMTSLPAAATVFSYNDGFLYSNPELTDSGIDQQLTVRGTIKDATTGEPLAGVTVVVKGTTIGTLSDGNGKFSITVPTRDALLSFSFIGFTPTEMKATVGTDMIISMSTEVTQISEVVVIGYGVQKKESVVGAITQVTGATLMKSASTNVTSAIAGKLSGVLTIQETGQPGANSSEIIVRGLSSWNGSAPLVLVDGVERDFKDLDPNEINTISVLKDASATAVFGAKGANGVIIVTTKRGSIGKPKMDFSASYGMEKATRIPDFISSYTTMSMFNDALMNGGQYSELIKPNILEEYRNPSTPLNSLRYPNVNWYSLLTKPFAPSASANFNVQGGTDFIKYFASLGYLSQGDYFKSYDAGFDDTRAYFNKINYRANVDFTLTKSTQLSVNLGGDVGITNNEGRSPWRNLYQASPSRFPAYYPAWVLKEVPDPDYPNASGIRFAFPVNEYVGNPWSSINQGYFSRYTNSKLFTDLILDQKLDFILKGLSAKGRVSLSTYFENNSLGTSYTFPEYQLDYAKIGVPGQNPWYREGEGNELYQLPTLDLSVGGLSNNFYSDLYYEMALNYSNTFGNHTVTGLALMNRQQQNTSSDKIGRIYYGPEFPFYNEALVGRATYDFKHKYLVEVNIGYTGSERFAPSNRFGFFPSGAVGWVISEENFFKNAVPWMNKLKIRYSDGLVGSDYANSRWLYISDYSTRFSPGGGGLNPSSYSSTHIYEDAIANVTAQWESARKRDIGVELGIFKNQFTLSVDLFDEYRDKMLLTPRSVTFIVGNNFKELNKGIVKKHGIEIEAEYNKTTSSNLNFFIRGIFGYNENRVIYKDDLPYAADYQKDAGSPIDGQKDGVNLIGKGYYTSVDEIHNNPAPISLETVNVGDYKFLDYNIDGTINQLDKHMIEGSSYPPITLSLSSGLSYKNFDFSFMLQGNVGKYLEYNQIMEMEFCKGAWRVHSSALDYWRPDNQDATHATLHWSGTAQSDIMAWGGGGADAGYYLMLKDHLWRKADYLRLKEMFLGYTFKSDFLDRVAGISNLQIYTNGFNLFTLTNLIEGDPEIKSFQYGYYPVMASIRFGIKVGF